MKRKRTKPAKTKQEQAAEEGWVYVYALTTIRGWNSIWVEEAREGRGEAEEKALRPCIPAPTGYGLLGGANYAPTAREGEREERCYSDYHRGIKHFMFRTKIK